MAKIGRNDPCQCGSGKKYKLCCLRKGERSEATPAGAVGNTPDPQAPCLGPLGPLRGVAPSTILRGAEDEVGKYFLALALAFNDLKGLLFFFRWLEEKGRPPADTITAEAGEWHGFAVQLERTLCAYLFEFFEFIKANSRTRKEPEFQHALASLQPETSSRWEDLVEIAHGKGGKKVINSALREVRNKVAYHNDRERLSEGYSAFFQAPWTNRNRNAYFSVGVNMEATRFHYADAAAQAAMPLGSTVQSNADISRLVHRIADEVNSSVVPLLGAFLRGRQPGGRLPSSKGSSH